MCEGGGQANATVIERGRAEMEFTFSEEQEDFRRAVATTLAAEVPPSYVRAMIEDDGGRTPELWSKMAELGWLGVLVPEERGRPGARTRGPGRLARRARKTTLSWSFPSSAVAATIAAVRLERKSLLADLASGTWRGTVAVEEPGHGDPLGDGTCDGDLVRRRELDPPGLQAARLGRAQRGIGCSWSPTTVRDSPHSSWRIQQESSSRRRCDPQGGSLSSSTAGPQRRVGPAGDQTAIWRRVLDDLGVAVCAELVGTCERALSLAVEYAKERVEFDRPIATFQVIKHKAADMLHKVELARVGTHYAAWASDSDSADRERAAAMGKGNVRRGGQPGDG